jgi:hypothetical protein
MVHVGATCQAMMCIGLMPCSLQKRSTPRVATKRPSVKHIVTPFNGVTIKLSEQVALRKEHH